MGFQIKDKDGKARTINDLDQDACTIWGVDINDEHYAEPYERANNWFDEIGYLIHSPTTTCPYFSGWKEIKKNLMVMHMEGSFLKDDGKPQTSEYVAGMFQHLVDDYLKPYYELIDYWDALGYTPHKVD